MHGWQLSLKIRIWGKKKGSVLAAETPCLAVGSWLALTPRPRFSEGGLKAASRRSANPVSLPSLRQPHSFHRTLSNEHFRFIKGSFGNIFSSVKKKKKQTKQATKWELMWTPRCRLQRRGGSSSLHLGREYCCLNTPIHFRQLPSVPPTATPLCLNMAHLPRKLPRGTFSSQSSGAADVHPPGLGREYHTGPSLDAHVPRAGRSR